MSDLGAAWVAVTGTVVGASVTGWFASRQAKAQERVVKAQLDFEREKLAAERRSAAAAETEARERAALTALGATVETIDQRVHRHGHSVTRGDHAEIQRLAYQVTDPVLHELAEHPAGILSMELLQRAGYLLRTPATQRTETGHRTPRTPER